MKRKAAALALALFLAMLACAPQPSPEKIELARRWQKAVGSYGEQIERGLLQLAARPPFTTAPDIYRQSVHKKVAAHRSDIAKLEEELAMLAARRLSETYLRAALAYEESALGHSIRQKQRLATDKVNATGGPREKLALTAQEQAARKNYLALEAKEPSVKDTAAEEAKLMTPLTAKIRREAILDFCDNGGSCPAPLLERLTAQEWAER